MDFTGSACSADVSEPAVSSEVEACSEPASWPSLAEATPGLLAIAIPRPNATASPPTLPMNRLYGMSVDWLHGVFAMGCALSCEPRCRYRSQVTTVRASTSSRRVESPQGKEEVVAAVLRAAADLFAERGLAATSIRDIAARSRVNHGLIHRHFGSKDGLVAAVLDHLGQHLAELLADNADGGMV